MNPQVTPKLQGNVNLGGAREGVRPKDGGSPREDLLVSSCILNMWWFDILGTRYPGAPVYLSSGHR